ncbi:uncharacterized protein LOC126319844 [Schistocerca gregaria]|uniref:uncharacterized protein LOC126319844 n=1 Tax=Schistocerca gregaria TaxID=7010 RepID=UPI00211E992A|nr:uncharacterized protein LOC126319844 [Schistocerca gregaria]
MSDQASKATGGDKTADDTTEGVVTVCVEKEGDLEFYKKSKCHNYYFMLSGGGLYYKSKSKDTELKGIIKLQTATVNYPAKKPVSWELVVKPKQYTFSASNEEEAKQWVNAITANCGKKLGDVDLGKKKQSRSMAFKKNIVGKASSSSFLRTVLAELSKDDTFAMYMKQLKRTIALYSGRKKEEEIEGKIYHILTKIVLLYQNGDLLEQDFDELFTVLRDSLSLNIDYLELPFAFEAKNISNYWITIIDLTVRLISNYVTDKTISEMRELCKYLSDESFQTFLFTDPKCADIREKMKAVFRLSWKNFDRNKE